MFKLKRALLSALRAFKAELAARGGLATPSQPEAACLYPIELGVNAGAAEAAPVVHGAITERGQTATEAPPPTFAEIVSQLCRFTTERVVRFPGEGLQFAVYAVELAEKIGPELERYRAAVAFEPSPEPATKTDVLN